MFGVIARPFDSLNDLPKGRGESQSRLCVFVAGIGFPILPKWVCSLSISGTEANVIGRFETLGADKD